MLANRRGVALVFCYALAEVTFSLTDVVVAAVCTSYLIHYSAQVCEVILVLGRATFRSYTLTAN